MATPGNRDAYAARGDLDGDGIEEVVRLEPEVGTGPPRARVAITSGGMTTRTPWYPAWKLLVGDVDGDGRAEIILALARTDRRDRRVRNRLYVYGWAGDGLVDRFRGSSFPRPFIDFALERGAPDGRLRVVLLALDLPGRTFRRETYRWMNFGFAREDSVVVRCPRDFPDDPDTIMAPGLLSQCHLVTTTETR
jgi:hypothetical protein